MVTNSTLHLIDTCVLVNIRDKYGDSRELWLAVIREIEAGNLKTTRQVMDELESRFNDIYQRLKHLKKVFQVQDGDMYTVDVIAEIRAIQDNHPGLYNRLGSGNPADPFLIAIGKARSAIVITDEKPDGKGHKSKIPYVCLNRNVGWTPGPKYLKLLGFDV